MRTKILTFLFLLTTISVFGQVKRVAVLETVDRTNSVVPGIKLIIRGYLTSALSKHENYEPFDRVDISSILGEQNFQQSGLISEDDIKKIGVMSGADYILVTEAAGINDETVALASKIIDASTGHIEQSSAVMSSINQLEDKCRILVASLLGITVNPETGVMNGEITYEGNKYVGEYKNGKPHGKGRLEYTSADDGPFYYEGDWVNGKKEGNGKLYITMYGVWYLLYEGEWKNDLFEGYGTRYFPHASGYWKAGVYMGLKNEDF